MQSQYDCQAFHETTCNQMILLHSASLLSLDQKQQWCHHAAHFLQELPCKFTCNAMGLLASVAGFFVDHIEQLLALNIQLC